MISNTMNPPRKEDDPHALDQITIREAAEADNVAFLARIRATPMGGRIALRIDLELDLFFSYLLAAMRWSMVCYRPVRAVEKHGVLAPTEIHSGEHGHL